MKDINDISLVRLNNGAHFMFIKNVNDRVQSNNTLKTKLGALATNLNDALNKEDEAMLLSQKSLITDDIAAADELRDSIYSGYKKVVDGYRKLPVASIEVAAKELWQHIKDYSINPQDQLDKETGMLLNFIDDLETKYAPQVLTLSLTVFVDQLKIANEKVRRLTSKRTDERSTQAVGALKQARKNSDNAYRELVKMVNALALIEGIAPYEDFIDYLNTEIAHFKREVIPSKKKDPKP